MNTLKTTLLLGCLTGLLLFIGGYFGGQGGMAIALLFAAGINFFSYWYSDKIVLRIYKARPVGEREAPELYRAVKELCLRASLPMPKVFIIPKESPNAFATGRDPEHAAVAVTKGILKLLSAEELRGVLSHELAHVKNRDILISSIAATIAAAVSVLAYMARFAAIFGGVGRSDDDEGGGIVGLLIMSIVVPIAAMIIQLAISRSREYLADSSGAAIAGEGHSLASALEKLSHASKRIPLKGNPATAHMFIVNPLSGKGLLNLFSTHPPVKERIKRLRSI